MLFQSSVLPRAALATSLLVCLSGMCQAAAPNVMDSAMGGLSAPCAGNALKSLQSNPKLSNCLNLLGLVQLATLSQDESVLPPLQNYIRGINEEPPCQQADLVGVNDTINMNCQKPSDQKSPTLGVLRMLINNYNPLRAMLVASPANATKSDEFCLTNMLKAAEKSSGRPFTQPYLQQLMSGDVDPFIQMLDKNPSVYCNNCGKTVASLAVVIASNSTAGAGTTAKIQQTLDGKCGANFTPMDGSVPSDVKVTGGASSTVAAMFTFGFTLAVALVWSGIV